MNYKAPKSDSTLQYTYTVSLFPINESTWKHDKPKIARQGNEESNIKKAPDGGLSPHLNSYPFIQLGQV